MAHPGSRIGDDLRDDDLVVYRSFKFRGSAWRGILVSDQDRDSLFREGTDRLRGDAVILRRVLVRPAPVPRVSLPPGRGEPDEGAEDQPSPATSVCARDVAVNETMALLIAGKAPLPVSAGEIKRAAANAGIRDDYKSVAAVVPATAERRLLIFFHGNGNYVTVAPTGDVPARVEASGHSRVPRWASAAGRARIIGDPRSQNKGVAAAQIKYGFLSLAAAQQALTPRIPSPVAPSRIQSCSCPRMREAATGSSWAVPPSGQYGTVQRWKAEGPGTKRLEELVTGVLRASPLPPQPIGPSLSRARHVSARVLGEQHPAHLCRRSFWWRQTARRGGRCGYGAHHASSVAGVGGRAVDFWLFDCTYKFNEEYEPKKWRPVGIHNYVNFCTNWHNSQAARLSCRQRTVSSASTGRRRNRTTRRRNWRISLRTEIAAVLKVSPPACSSCTTAATCRRHR